MRTKRNLITITALIGLTTLAASSPAIYSLLIEVAFADKYYAIFPLIVCFGYGLIAFYSLRQSNKTLMVALGIGIPLLIISFIGQFKDFTSNDVNGPGPYEWINRLSPYTTCAIMALVGLRYVMWRQKEKISKSS